MLSRLNEKTFLATRELLPDKPIPLTGTSKPYRSFVVASKYLLFHPVLERDERDLLLYLIGQVDGQEGREALDKGQPVEVRVPRRTIERELGIGWNTLHSATLNLERFGLIETDATPEGKVYTLRPGPWPWLGDAPRESKDRKAQQWCDSEEGWHLAKLWRKAVLEYRVDHPDQVEAFLKYHQGRRDLGMEEPKPKKPKKPTFAPEIKDPVLRLVPQTAPTGANPEREPPSGVALPEATLGSTWSQERRYLEPTLALPGASDPDPLETASTPSHTAKSPDDFASPVLNNNITIEQYNKSRAPGGARETHTQPGENPGAPPPSLVGFSPAQPGEPANRNLSETTHEERAPEFVKPKISRGEAPPPIPPSVPSREALQGLQRSLEGKKTRAANPVTQVLSRYRELCQEYRPDYAVPSRDYKQQAQFRAIAKHALSLYPLEQVLEAFEKAFRHYGRLRVQWRLSESNVVPPLRFICESSVLEFLVNYQPSLNWHHHNNETARDRETQAEAQSEAANLLKRRAR